MLKKVLLISLTIFVFTSSLKAQLITKKVTFVKLPNLKNLESFLISSLNDTFLVLGLGGRIIEDSFLVKESFFKISARDCFDTTYSINDLRDTVFIRSNCPYDYNKKFCKKCKSKKNVIKILYGLILFDLDGNNPYGEFEDGGCGVRNCQPHWYCKKCKSRF